MKEKPNKNGNGTDGEYTIVELMSTIKKKKANPQWRNNAEMKNS